MIVWCEVMSTRGHRNCTRRACGCPCHLARGETLIRRPHGYSRERWNQLGEASRFRVVRARSIPRRRPVTHVTSGKPHRRW